jgi:L-iditol 2-dehydrogenase/threonine 3-dehydrogenase
MKAYIIDRPHEMRFGDLCIPQIKEGEILMKTRQVTVCVTDVYYYKGVIDPPHWPIIPGHEYMGEVVESNNDRVKVGEKLVYWGQTEFGGLAEYRAITPIFPDTKDDIPWRDHRGFYDAGGAAAVILNERLPEPSATFLEPMCSILRTLLFCPPKPGDHALVIGAGPIGLIALQLFKNYYACPSVTVLEKNPHRLQVAVKLGADYAFNPTQDRHAIESLIKESGGAHVQYVFDTLSNVNDDVRTLAMELLEREGIYNVFGATQKSQEINTWLILSKGIYVRSTPFDVRTVPMWRSACAIALAQKLLLHDVVSVSPLLSQTIDFTDFNEVKNTFDHYGRDGILKTLIRFPDS